MTRSIVGFGACLVLVAAATAACGGDDGEVVGATTSRAAVSAGTPPMEMCGTGQIPIAASYDLLTGEERWHLCADPTPQYGLEAADDQAVYLTARSATGSKVVLSVSAADGTERWAGDLGRMEEELGGDAVRARTAPAVDGVRLSGGQDDPLVATDASTGAELWRNTDRLTYDDVWAVGDGAVYMSHDWGSVPKAILRAYELETGDIRWETTLDEPESYPWWVADGRVFSIWINLTVLAADDGEVLWRTDHPGPSRPMEPWPIRMNGVLANDEAVFVSFVAGTTGGD